MVPDSVGRRADPSSVRPVPGPAGRFRASSSTISPASLVAEPFGDERRAARAGHRPSFFGALRASVEDVMIDNGPAIAAGGFRAFLASEGVRPRRPGAPQFEPSAQRMRGPAAVSRVVDLNNVLARNT